MTHVASKSISILPPPPDGGWGWVVVFASFMIHIVTDGVTYSFGVFHVALVEYFKEGDSATSWIPSILVGTTLCSGPISSAFVNKYGCRPVTIAGAVLASFSLIVSSFAQNVTTLYFSAGIGAGFGLGLIYLPAIVSVTTYFEKYRSLATGIAVCGSGLGTFLFAPVIEILVASYGWRSAIAIVGGLVLCCVIFGILFRPLESVEQLPLNGIRKDIEELQPIKDNSSDTNPTNTLSVDDTQRRPHSVHAFILPPKQSNSNVANGKQGDIVRVTTSQPMLVASLDTHGRTRHISESGSLKKTQSSGIMYKKDVLYRGSLANIHPQHRSTGCIHTAVKKPEEKLLMVDSQTAVETSLENEETICGCIPCHKETKDGLMEMLDFSLLKDPIFIIFTLSNFCTSVGFCIPYVYIVAQALKKGISQKNSSYLLAIIGMANTVSRIILGYLSDKPWVNRLYVYNWCLTICGLSSILSAFCYDFMTFSLYATTFGFTIGAYVGLTSVILVDLLGLDKLTNAFGLLLLFQGIASLLGPPIGGKLYDILNSYDPAFYLGGGMIAVSGIMLFAIPLIQKFVLTTQTKRKDDNIECS
uniref:Major facilitator superfamily (MFS) profile domain-containing protein n=2 Tax=Clastoptera arizonana TaxID=38151 RepID=A0A1B6D5R3_9HEMI